MRTLKLHYPTGHPYWNKDEYKIELPDGTFYDKSKHYRNFGGGHRVLINEKGIFYQQCYSGSGYGKIDLTDKFPPVLMLSKNEYDNIEFIGINKEISENLKNDLAKNGL